MPRGQVPPCGSTLPVEPECVLARAGLGSCSSLASLPPSDLGFAPSRVGWGLGIKPGWRGEKSLIKLP